MDRTVAELNQQMEMVPHTEDSNSSKDNRITDMDNSNSRTVAKMDTDNSSRTEAPARRTAHQQTD